MYIYHIYLYPDQYIYRQREKSTDVLKYHQVINRPHHLGDARHRNIGKIATSFLFLRGARHSAAAAGLY